MKMSSNFSALVTSICIATSITDVSAQKLSNENNYTASIKNVVMSSNTTANNTIKTKLATVPPDEKTYTLTIVPSKIKAFDATTKNAVTVKFKSHANQSLNLSLVNDNGGVLYNKSDNNVNNFFERLNLKDLALGNYNLIVEKGLTKTFQPFELTANGIVMTEKNRITKFLPQILQKGTKLDINVMMTKSGNVHVNIYNNEDGKLVFEENNTKIVNLNKRFDISNLHHGEYTVEVLSDDEVAYLEIRL